jgi:hypothetical protein
MADPAPQPISDPDKHKDRAVAWRGNVLTAITVLAAGFLGGAAGIGGTIITTNSQASQAQEEFLRSQRQAQYAKYLTDADRLYAEMTAPFFYAGNEEIKTRLENELAVVNENYGQIQLLAGAEVEGAAEAATIDLRQYVLETSAPDCRESESGGTFCSVPPWVANPPPAGTQTDIDPQFDE